MRVRRFTGRSTPKLAAVLLLLVLGFLDDPASAQTFTALYSFTSGSTGEFPYGNLISDSSGNLYGTAGGGFGFGVVFELTPPSPPSNAWTENMLYEFHFTDGEIPFAPLVFDSNGNLFGTTIGGGQGPNCNGCGTVFELSPPAIGGQPWTESTLYTFQGGQDGELPDSGLIFDAAGNLYGTTGVGGGGTGCGGVSGCGTVFELSPPAIAGDSWTETVLYRFLGGSDGTGPIGSLTTDSRGNLYGVTAQDGLCTLCGIVYKLMPPKAQNRSWTKHVLHSFQDAPNDGSSPSGALFFRGGALYGLTSQGGLLGLGTAYRIAGLTGTPPETILYDFGSSAPSSYPLGGVVFDRTGNLYGVTGSSNNTGTVFRLLPPAEAGGAWTEKTLHQFRDGPDGGNPNGDLLLLNGSAIYGTTFYGGDRTCYLAKNGCGVVFEITK